MIAGFDEIRVSVGDALLLHRFIFLIEVSLSGLVPGSNSFWGNGRERAGELTYCYQVPPFIL